VEPLAETVVAPRSGRVFGLGARPGFADCAPSGRARLDALARWQQEAAYQHVEHIGLAADVAWVARRTRITVSRWPRFAEDLVVQTFCTGIGRMWVERRTIIARRDAASGNADVEAVALWVHLDPQTRSPSPFTDAELEQYAGNDEHGRAVSSKLVHPRPLGVDETSDWTFRATDCDLAGHVNNAAYWQPLEEELLTRRGPERATFDAEIEFRAPAQPGLTRVLADGDLGRGARRWIVGEGGELHASILLGGT